MIAVTTVRDEGAAEVAKEALDDAEIPVELRRLGANPYFGQVSAAEWEVRVPEERAADARVVLARVEHEAEEAAIRESGAGVIEPEAPSAAAAAETPPEHETPAAALLWRLVWVAIALAVVGFFAHYLLER